MSAAGRLCARCGLPIHGDEGIRTVGHSASGARPDQWEHADCDRSPARPLRPRPRRAR